MTYENYVKGKLVSFAAEEGMRYGGADCTLAVAQVLANRVRAGWQGGEWEKVIRDAPNYRGTEYPEPFEINPRDLTFRSLLQRIDEIYHGTAGDSLVNSETE